jgi:hypothetical protein
LINDQLERSAANLRAIVLADRWRRNGAPAETVAVSPEEISRLAESCRTERVRDEIQPILASFGG